MGGFNVYGQMIRAQLEQWSSSPTPGVTGRVGYNSVTNRASLDNGTVVVDVINDQGTVSNYLDYIQVADPGTSPASGSTRLYVKNDGNLYSKSSGGAVTQLTQAASVPIPYNYLFNSDFSIWQRGTSSTVTSQANPATPTYLYLADRWYVNNILGGGTIQGVITYSQATAVTNGSAFGAKVQITTAPTGTNIQNGCELYQVLENLDSRQLYGQSASFSVLVKSFGNVTQVGVQFYYATTEVKPTVAIGSEVLTTVNSATFTACTITNQALGTSQTAAGVIGVRIRITGVSSGNLYALNNGFVVEQPYLNYGSTVNGWKRKNQSFAQELAECQRFCELKGGEAATVPIGFGLSGTSGTSATCMLFFQARKRVIPTMTYSSQSGFIFEAQPGNYTCTAISSGNQSLTAGECVLTISGASANEPGRLYTTASAFLIVEAEI